MEQPETHKQHPIQKSRFISATSSSTAMALKMVKNMSVWIRFKKIFLQIKQYDISNNMIRGQNQVG